MSDIKTIVTRQLAISSPLQIFVPFCLCLLIFYGDCIAETRTATERIADTLKGDWGQLKFNLRYRYEQVDQDNLKKAKGDPLRLRFGYLTPQYKGLQGYLEGIVNTTVFVDDFNDTISGEKTEYAAIPDPNDEELNQVWLSWDTVGATNLKGGRQKIAYDNQRFISWCAFRQLEQTFDSVTLLNKAIGNLDLSAAYVWNILNVKNQEASMQTPLLNIKYLFPGLGALSGYGYWLDYSDADNSGSSPFAYSSQTFGLRFAGKTDAADSFDLLYEAEYANQSDYGDNPKSFAADYYHLVGGVVFPLEGSLVSGINAKIGYEVLGSDNGVPVQTPLGANHKFNGWADIFGINKPANGLRDFYASLMGNVGPLNLDFRYHDFSADEGSSDYGSEFDFKVAWKFKKHYMLAAIYASYEADEYKTDTDKLWLELTIDF